MHKTLMVATFLLASMLAACENAQPFNYAEVDNEFDKSAPGMFSGKAGEFVIFEQ